VSGVGVVIAFTGLMAWMAHTENMPGASLAFFGLIAGVGAMNLTWLPRILARRHAAEAARNRIAASIARREERRQAWVGIGLGLLFGGIGLGTAALLFGSL